MVRFRLSRQVQAVFGLRLGFFKPEPLSVHEKQWRFAFSCMRASMNFMRETVIGDEDFHLISQLLLQNDMCWNKTHTNTNTPPWRSASFLLRQLDMSWKGPQSKILHLYHHYVQWTAAWLFNPPPATEPNGTSKQLAAHQTVTLCNPLWQHDNKAAALMRQKPGCKYFIGIVTAELGYCCGKCSTAPNIWPSFITGSYCAELLHHIWRR